MIFAFTLALSEENKRLKSSKVVRRKPQAIAHPCLMVSLPLLMLTLLIYSCCNKYLSLLGTPRRQFTTFLQSMLFFVSCWGTFFFSFFSPKTGETGHLCHLLPLVQTFGSPSSEQRNLLSNRPEFIFLYCTRVQVRFHTNSKRHISEEAFLV